MLNARPQWFVAASLLFASSIASADVSSFPALEATARQKIDVDLARIKAVHAPVLAGVRTVVGQADALDHSRRGRFFPMTPMLRAVARRANGAPGTALAMLEPFLYPERFSMPTSPTARTSLRAGLLEASGDLKDPAAAPVYRSVIATSADAIEVRAAVEALGKLAQDADVSTLARLATTANPNQDAVIGGLGFCRKPAAARALADVAATHPDATRAKLVLGSLARVASAWGLATPHAIAPEDVVPLRTTAQQAALSLFVSATAADVRASASDALMAIDAPETPAAIGAARAAAPDAATRTALDELATRFAHNPTRSAR